MRFRPITLPLRFSAESGCNSCCKCQREFDGRRLGQIAVAKDEIFTNGSGRCAYDVQRTEGSKVSVQNVQAKEAI